MAEYESIDDLEAARLSMDNAGYEVVVLDEAVKAKASDGSMLGLILTVTEPEGYGGNIQFTIGIDMNGTITGLEILDISETAGLGMKAKESTFREQFIGINAESVGYVKNGAEKTSSDIDAISSATITTKAVTKGVNGALCAYRSIMGGIAND